MCGRFTLFEPDKILKKSTFGVRIRDRNSRFGREERQKREGPAVIAGPSQNAGKFGVAFRSFGT